MSLDLKSCGTAGALAGARDLVAATPAVFAFGLGFGAAAAVAEIDPFSAMAMSAFVFAGAAQYAALDLWRDPLPMVALAMTVFAINARHLVLGATLSSQITETPRVARYAAIALLSDANWAATVASATRGKVALMHLIGGGAILWMAWLTGTASGMLAGTDEAVLQRYGIDALMPGFFICMLIGSANKPRTNRPLAIAAVATVAAMLAMPPQWAVLVGAGCGVLLTWNRHAR